MSTKGARVTDYVRGQSGAALGARLRRLSDRVDREADSLYRLLGVDFEQRWFGVVNQLRLHNTRSVGQIAEALGVTHASVSQVRSALLERGLIAVDVDPLDSRRRALQLSTSGKQLVDDLASLWSVLNEVARELDAEAGGVTATLERLEHVLDARSLSTRVQARIGQARDQGPGDHSQVDIPCGNSGQLE